MESLGCFLRGSFAPKSESHLDVPLWWVFQTKTCSWTMTRWWFQPFFMFIPTWGDDPIWRAYFSNGLVQPPTRWVSEIFWVGLCIVFDIDSRFLDDYFAASAIVDGRDPAPPVLHETRWKMGRFWLVLAGCRKIGCLGYIYIYRGFYCPVLWGGSLSTNQYFIESIPRVFGPWLRRWISDAFFGVLTGFSSPLDHQEDDVLSEFGGLKGSGLNRNQQNDRNIQAILGLSLSWWCFLIDSIHHGIHHHVSPSFGRHFFPTTQPANPNFPYSFLIPTLTPSR